MTRNKLNKTFTDTVNAELNIAIDVTLLTAPAENGQPRFSVSGNKAEVEKAVDWLVDKGLLQVEEADHYEDPEDPYFRSWKMVAPVK